MPPPGELSIDVHQAGRHHHWPMPAGTTHIDLSPVVAGAELRMTVDPDGMHTTLSATQPFAADVQLTATIPVPKAGRVLWPTHQGLLERRAPAEDVTYEFRGPGWNTPLREDRRLAIPAVIVEAGTDYRVIGADPGFSAHLTVSGGAEPTVTVEWTYLASAGLHDAISRRIITAAVPSIEQALDEWFRLATPDVPPGPQWLHEIAWTNYDYMSKNGRGWFDDIDAFCDLVGPDNHQRAAFTLHAWYDIVGRYCYDPARKELDEAWTVFPYINDARLQARQGVKLLDDTPPAYTFRNLARYQPIQMDWTQVRERLRYAKDRGLRVPFYLMTGMLALGSQAEHAAAGDGLDASGGTWMGPDALGETYVMNPLHPEVRQRLLGLTQAVLDRVGDLIDALVIDEVYYVGYGQLGPPACPGYADLAQATLLQEMAQLCHSYRPDLAMLSADELGTQPLEERAYPYSLFLDGIYHDAWCHAQTYDACRFPTWRAIHWNCTWAPVSAIGNTKWAVLAHDAQVSTGNGCFGDDIGLAEMSENDKTLLHDLWLARTGRTRSRRLTIVDVEHRGSR